GCASGHEEVVRVLLDSGADVEDHNKYGFTPLMEAASAGHIHVAKVLLEHKNDINTRSNKFQKTPLTLACFIEPAEMLRLLLETDTNQEYKSYEMHAALIAASINGHMEVARLLLDSGAQVTMTNSSETPLTFAASRNLVNLAQLLIERGANIEEVNGDGYTPLMQAALQNNEEMIVLLLSEGADVNAFRNRETKETALVMAENSCLEIADLLIKAEADNEFFISLMEEGYFDFV
ncbi:ANR17 protein, partial [Acromyrmex heyeri]